MKYQIVFSIAFAAVKIYPTPWIDALDEYSFNVRKIDSLLLDSDISFIFLTILCIMLLNSSWQSNNVEKPYLHTRFWIHCIFALVGHFDMVYLQCISI